MTCSILRWLCLALLASTLSACMLLKQPLYEPVARSFTGPTAVIKDYWRNHKKADFPRLARAELFGLEKVDGKDVDNARRLTLDFHNAGDLYVSRMAVFEPLQHERRIPIRQTTLRLRGMIFHGGFIDAMAEDRLPVEGDVTFLPRAGVTYRVNGLLTTTHSSVWLEDEAGNPVTEKIEHRK